ncbi:MAG: c-type cytochrome, partial [Planctomycetaceae bacterium]|nr:c-type cytochrome [Planctomycetaceae bacterium]
NLLASPEKIPPHVVDVWKFTLPIADPFVDATFTGNTYFRPAAPQVDDDFRNAAQHQLEGTSAEVSERIILLSTLLGRRAEPPRLDILEVSLTARSPIVRRLAVQWVAEERLTQFRPQVEAVLKSDDMTSDLFLATLAALEMLDGKAPQDFDKTPPGKYVLPLLADSTTSAAVKRQALRLIDPADPALTAELLEPMLRSDDQQLRLEVLRTLAGSTLPEAAKWLSEAAVQHDKDRAIERMTAITGLASHANSDLAKKTLVSLIAIDLRERGSVIRSLRELVGKDEDVKRKIFDINGIGSGPPELWIEIEAQIALLPGGTELNGKKTGFPVPARPASDEAWFNVINEDGVTPSSFAGEQVFFHSNGPGCFKCHTIDGRGGRIGPDLTHIGGSFTRDKLVESILQPSKEVSPQFTTWNMATHDGRTLTGMLVHENLGETTLGNDKGELTTIQTVDIEARTPVKTSVMPEKLEDRMTVREFQDLIEFLANLK